MDIEMTLIQCDASVVVDTRNVAETFVVFEHQVAFMPNQPPEVILVGSCRLMDLYKLRDPRNNSEWAEIFKRGGTVLVRIVAVSDNRLEAQRYAMQHMRSFPAMPRCNARGYNSRRVSRPIICHSNSQKYRSQKHASDEMGISQSVLSRHLAGELQHAGGHVFSYASE